MRLVYFALMFTLLMAPLPAQADMVLDWNEYALETIRTYFLRIPRFLPGLWPLPRRPYTMPSIPSTKTNQPYYKFSVSVNTTPPPPKPRWRPPVTLLWRSLFPSQSATLHGQV